MESLPPITEWTPITTLDLTLFGIFLPFWFIVYYRAVLSPSTGKPDGFDSSTFISNLHSIPLCILAFLSLQELIPENVPLCWTIAFFVLDMLDTIVRRDAMFFVHAVISMCLNVCGGFSARHRTLRSVSKGFFAEASTVCLLYLCCFYLLFVQCDIYLERRFKICLC